MKYFPDIFYKKDPPRSYFWKVISVIKKDIFKRHYDEASQRIKKKIRKSETMNVTEEHRQMMNSLKEENLKTLMALKRTGSQKNIVYISKRRAQDFEQAPNMIDRYFNNQGNRTNEDQA